MKMNQRITMACMAMLLVAVLFGCKKEEIEDVITPPTTQSFTYTAKGASQTATGISVQKGQSQLENLNIRGENQSYSAILNIDSNMSEGTYAIDHFGGPTSFTLTPTGFASSMKMVGGQLKITAHNKTTNRIEGTFSGICYDSPSSPADSIVVSGGSFTVNY